MEDALQKQLKMLKGGIGPDPAFRAQARHALLMSARALGREGQDSPLRNAWTSFALGAALALAGWLLFMAAGQGTIGRDRQRAEAPFEIKIPEARYEVTEAARVALGELEAKIRALTSSDQRELLKQVEQLKQLLN